MLQKRIDAVMAGRNFPVRPDLLGGVAVILLAFFAYQPLFGGGMMLTGDTLQAWRIFELGRCLDDGQIPCRWTPDLGNGYGVPLFNYYPPLPYYAGDVLHRIGFSYLRAVDILFMIGLIGAALSMYVFARKLWGNLGGMVSAIAYVYAPYLALDVYMRGALTELWALAIAPALLWAVHELVTSGRPRYVPAVALFTGLLLLSHSLVAVIMAPAVALWSGALLIRRGREGLRPAALGVAAALWGFGLAAFFTLPVLLEGADVQLDSLSRWPFIYSDHFVSVSDLFFSRTADYGFILGIGDDTPIQIGWFHWALAGLSLPAGVLLMRSKRRASALAVPVFAVLLTIGIFMTLSASESVWDTFDSLRFMQFPWRYMGLVSLASAVLAGAWLALLRDRATWTQLFAAAVLIGLFAGSGKMFFEPVVRLDISDAEVFSGEFADLYRRGGVPDFLPAAVDEVPEPSSVRARVVAGAAVVQSVETGSDWLTMQVEASTPSRIQASVFDYPNWRVEIDGEAVAHEASVPNGLITFDIPAGTHDVELRLSDTGVRRAGNRLSVLSWAAFALVVPAIFLGPKLRQWSWPLTL